MQFCFQGIGPFLDKMKPLALMKLAAQCAEYYLESQKQLQRDAVRGLFDKVITLVHNIVCIYRLKFCNLFRLVW